MTNRAILQRELLHRSAVEKQTSLDVLEQVCGIDRVALKYELMQLHNQGTVFGVIMGDYLVYLARDDKTIPDIKTMLGIDQAALEEEMASRKEAKFSSDGTAQLNESFSLMTNYSREHNVENNLTLQVRTGFRGAKIILFISIENSNDWDMEKLKVRIDLPPILKFSKLLNEDLQAENHWNQYMIINVPSVKAKEVYSIFALFKPIDIGSFEFKGNVQFYNAEKKVRFIPIEPLGLKLMPPPLKKIENEVAIEPKDYMKDANMKKNILSFGIPDEIDSENLFNIIIKLLVDNEFKEISVNESQDRLIGTYFGEFEQNERKGSILVIAQIYNGKYELYGCSENGFAVATLLTKIAIEIRSQIDSINNASEPTEIIDLNCVKCDVPLPFNPDKGESIQCVKCETMQTPRP